MTRSKSAFSFVLAIAALTSLPAYASTITFDFTATGINDQDSSNPPVAAWARFVIDSGGILTITLRNDQSPVGFIAQSLTGIDFTLSGTGPFELSLSQVDATAFLNCTDQTCVEDSEFHTYKGNGHIDQTLDSPYGWQIVSTSPYELFAGGTAWHPAGIVSADPIGTSDGVANAQHNDWLLGPVTFTIALGENIPTDVENVHFYFGTSSALKIIPGEPGGGPTVPEPSTLILLGTGLLTILALARKPK